MKRIVSLLAGVFFLAAALPAMAQDQEPASPESVPAATTSQIECSGYINPTTVANDLFVEGGPDNDFVDPYHTFSAGDYIFLRVHQGTAPAVGAEFRLVRPANDVASESWVRGGLGPLPDFGYHEWYPGQDWDIRKLGRPYQDVGRAKVIKLMPHGVVAQVTFNCTAVHTGDLAIRYEPRPIPTYTPTAQLDRFALTNGKHIGAITAVRNNFDAAGPGDIVYLNLGQSFAQPGQKYRVVHVLLPGHTLLVAPELPDETVGEVVILWTQENSSVGVVVSATRQVVPGDVVQLE